MRMSSQVRHSPKDEAVTYIVEVNVSPQTREKCADAFIKMCLQQHMRRPALQPLKIFNEQVDYEVL